MTCYFPVKSRAPSNFRPSIFIGYVSALNFLAVFLCPFPLTPRRTRFFCFSVDDSLGKLRNARCGRRKKAPDSAAREQAAGSTGTDRALSVRTTAEALDGRV